MGKNLDAVIKSLGLEKTAQRSAEIGVPESRSVESLERAADRHSWEQALEQERRRQQQEQRKREQAMSWKQKQSSMINLLQGVAPLDTSDPMKGYLFSELTPVEIANKAKEKKTAGVQSLQAQIDALEAQKKPVGMDQTNAPHNRQIDEQIKPLRESADSAMQEAADVNQITLALMSDADRKALSNYVNQRRTDWYDTLTQGVYGNGVIGTPGGRAEAQVAELARKYGWDNVKSLAETLERQQNAEATARAQQEGAELGQEHPILGSAASIPLNVVSGAPAVFERIRGLGTSTGQYPTLDPNNAGNLLGTVGSAIQGQVASGLEGDGSNGWRKAGSMLYRGIMSAAESGLRGKTGKVGTVLLSGLGSFEQNVAKASAQGASPDKAVTLGLTNAAIEALSEEIPLDNLMEQAKHSGKGFGKVLKNALIQAGIEASTEEASLIGTTLAEAAIGLMSGAQSVRDYRNSIQAQAQQDARQAADNKAQRQAAQQATETPMQGEAADPRHQKKQQAEAREAAQAMEQAQQAQQAAQPPATHDPLLEGIQTPVTPTQEQTRQQDPVANMLNPIQNPQQSAVDTPSPQNYNGNAITIPGAAVGSSGVTYTADNKPLSFQYAVVPAESLITSNDQFGNVNRAYPAELQPRDRTRVASQSQINNISRNLNPALLAESPTAQNGAPIIRGDGVVIGGNGRASAITHAYGAGRGADYQQFITQKAAELGIDPATIPANPVLVRVTNGVNNYTELANSLNAATTASYSATETAKIDASRIGDIIAHLSISENGGVNTAENRKFIQEFVSQVVPESERGDVMQANGQLSQAGERRIQNALFAYAYGDTALVERLAESTDNNVKNITNAMLSAAGKVAQLQAEIGRGEVQDLGLQQAITDAANLYLDAKAGKLTVEDAAGQLVLGGNGPESQYDGLTVNLAKFMESNSRSGLQIRTFIDILADVNMNMPAESASQFSLFGTSGPQTQEGLYNEAVAAYDQQRDGKGRIPEKSDFSQYRQYRPGELATDMDGSRPEGNPGPAAPDGGIHQAVQGTVPGGQRGVTDPNSPGIKGTGAAERGFAGPPAYDDLLTDANSQRDRFDDVRPVEVPKTDTQGRTVSEFVGNAYGSALTKESFIPTIKKLVTDGSLSHDVQTNQASLESAAQDIVLDGLLRSLNDVRDTAQSGKVGTNDIAKATLLYQYLCETTDANGNAYPEDIVTRNQEWAAEAFASLTQMATASGRNLQLFSLFRQMTPEGQMREIQKEVQAFVRRAKRLGTVDQRYEPQLDTELFDEFRDAAEALREEDSPENRKRVTDAQNAIYADTSSQMPATFKAKWDAWRYMAMMGNMKTQVRNVAGNAMYMPYVEAKRAIGAAIERVALKQDQRTKAVLNLTSESDRQLLQWAKNDSKEGDSANALKYSAKLGDDTTMQEFMGQRRIFDTELLEKARKAVDTATSAGDMVFKNHEYAVSLAGFLKARGYTEADILSGKVSDSTLTEARAYAVNEALKATFNDSNAFSDALASELRYKGDNPIMKALNTAAEGVMPFRRTPANVVVRAFENSPIGLVKGVRNMATQVKNGNVSAATAIDQISAGLTGTAAMGLGYLLASGFAGIKLRGSDVDDDEKRQGYQEYALEFSIGGQEYSYTIDWAAPANLPLFVGANLYSALEGSGKDASYSTLTAIVRALGLSFEPMLALSCMSSLNDLIEAGKYSDGNALYSLAAQAATSYLTQGIPSLARQTYQAVQKNKQSTFANSADPLLRGMQRKAAGVPFLGAAFQTDKVDEWGQKESTGSFPERIFNAYFNPGTSKAIDNSPLEREIIRLNGAQPDSVSPPSTAKTITYTDTNGEKHKDQRLTEEQYSTLTTVQGQTAKDILDGALDSSIYQSMTDEQKVKVFDYTYAYARELGRTEAIDGYQGMDAWMEAAEKNPTKAILDKVVKSGFDDAFDSLTHAWEYGKDTASAASSLEDAYSVYSGMGKEEQKEFKKETGGRVGYFLDAKDAGISGKTFTELYKTFSDISAQNSNASAKATNWAYYLEKEKSAGHITASQEATLKGSMAYYNIFPAETKKFDQLTDAGLSADNAYKVGKLLDGIQGTGAPDENGEPKVTNQDKYAAIASSDLPEKDKEIALMSYLQGKLGEKYEYARDEMQLNVEDFVDAYRVTSEYSRKEQQISAWMDMGYTKKEANNLYKLYKGKLT